MTTSDDDDVLAANRAFYRAFAERDFAAMAALWAETAPIACIHPGWDALTGRAAVLASWRDLLAQPANPAIECRDARVLNYGTAALVICHEVLAEGVLVATNGFVREGGAWRLMHHQAGGVATSLVAEPAANRLH